MRKMERRKAEGASTRKMQIMKTTGAFSVSEEARVVGAVWGSS